MWSWCGIEFDARPDVRPVRGVPGLYLARNIVSDLEEAALLASIASERQSWVERNSRLTKNYGPYYVYKQSARRPIALRQSRLPTWATGFLQKRLRAWFEKQIPRNWTVNQVHVALYQASQKNKIRPHNDTTMGKLMNAVVGVSLGDVATMTFEHGRHKKEVKLPRRSAYLMTDDSLKLWTHRIRAHHNTGNRLSITCRNVISLRAPVRPATTETGNNETNPALQSVMSQQTVNTDTTAQTFLPSEAPPAMTETNADMEENEYPVVDLLNIVQVRVSQDKVRKLRNFHNM